MITKQLFFTIVALGILFLPFSVVAADKNAMWQQLIEQKGCLLSSTDINYTICGSVFEKKLWKNFLNYAQNNKAVPLITVDGIYGNRTKEAVIAVQKLSGIPQTGAVGPLTWNAIVNLYNEYR
jgi:murein L,D-transpeptidase YcbB/YkuD